MTNCVFCKIINKTLSSEIIWEDEQYLAFLDLNPIQPGHTLLIPRFHCDDAFDLPNEGFVGLFERAKILQAILRKSFNSKRVGLVLEGFGVPHAHLHLIPVNTGNQIDPNLAKPAKFEELKAVADRIRGVAK